VGNYLLEAAAALVRFAKATSDQKVAAGLIDKAVDIAARIGDEPASSSDASLQAPDVQPVNKTTD
jgi:hypothetical protein